MEVFKIFHYDFYRFTTNFLLNDINTAIINIMMNYAVII